MATIALTVRKVQERYLRPLAGSGGALVRFRRRHSLYDSPSSKLGPLSLSFLWLTVALVSPGLNVLGVPEENYVLSVFSAVRVSRMIGNRRHLLIYPPGKTISHAREVLSVV